MTSQEKLLDTLNNTFNGKYLIDFNNGYDKIDDKNIHQLFLEDIVVSINDMDGSTYIDFKYKDFNPNELTNWCNSILEDDPSYWIDCSDEVKGNYIELAKLVISSVNDFKFDVNLIIPKKSIQVKNWESVITLIDSNRFSSKEELIEMLISEFKVTKNRNKYLD